jgi:hypothetical protein
MLMLRPLFIFMSVQVQGIPPWCAGGNRCGGTWPGRTWHTGEGAGGVMLVEGWGGGGVRGGGEGAGVRAGGGDYVTLMSVCVRGGR